MRRPSEGPTLSPVACSPQAWASASASVFYQLQACLGLSFDSPARRIRFDHPASSLPDARGNPPAARGERRSSIWHSSVMHDKPAQREATIAADFTKSFCKPSDLARLQRIPDAVLAPAGRCADRAAK